MDMKQQTAVEQFAIALYEKGLLKGNGDDMQELFEQFKVMEKEQIMDAWNLGRRDIDYFANGEQYYKEIYE
jgi:hypothetical protein